jgi:hypothetical protein
VCTAHMHVPPCAQHTCTRTPACVFVLQVMLLMPFLATDWSSSRQRLLRVAARFAHPLGAVVGSLQRLPAWLLDSLVHVAEPAAEPHTREGIKALLNASGVRNNFHLAQHEFRWVWLQVT